MNTVSVDAIDSVRLAIDAVDPVHLQSIRLDTIDTVDLRLRYLFRRFPLHRELDRISGRSRSQVVHSSLEALQPSVEVHRGQLGVGSLAHVNVEGLRLIDELASVSCHVDNVALWDLPDSLVQFLNLVRDAGDALNRSAVAKEVVLHAVVPQTQVGKLPEQVGVDNLESTRKHLSAVHVGSVRLEALVESEDL